MKSSLVLLLLSPLLTTTQDSQQEEELVLTVGDLVMMYNEEEDGAALVSRQPKQIVNQESVDFNAVVGKRGGAILVICVVLLNCHVTQMLGRRRNVLRKLCWSSRRSGAKKLSVTTGL